MSAQLPRPTAILVVSAHWEEAPHTLSASDDDLRASTTVVDGFWYGLSKRSWQFN